VNKNKRRKKEKGKTIKKKKRNKRNKDKLHVSFWSLSPISTSNSKSTREEEEVISTIEEEEATFWRPTMSCSLKSEATSGEPMCHCGVPARLKTSFTEDNFGKLFFGCVNYEVWIFFIDL
jgi:hypothetical protein